MTRASEGRVAVIVATGGTASANAAYAATTTIPIIFASSADPARNRLGDARSSRGAAIAPAPSTIAATAAHQVRSGRVNQYMGAFGAPSRVCVCARSQ